MDLFKSLLPEIYDIVVKIDQRLRDELTAIGGYDEPLPGQEDEEEAPADPCEDCECATCQEKPCDTCEEEIARTAPARIAWRTPARTARPRKRPSWSPFPRKSAPSWTR